MRGAFLAFCCLAVSALAAQPARPVNVCPSTAYLIQDPKPDGYRCLAPVRPTGQYQQRIIQNTTTDFYGCNKQCFIDNGCRAQLWEPFQDGSGNGFCSTYTKPGGSAPGRLLRDRSVQFSNRNCIYTPTCFQLQVQEADNEPTLVNKYWETVVRNGLPTVVLTDNPATYYYFDVTGRFISDFNGYGADAAYPAVVPIGTPGQLVPMSFPDDANQQSGEYNFASVACGYNGIEFTCGSQAGGTLIACTDDYVVENAKDETAGSLPGCSVIHIGLVL